MDEQKERSSQEPNLETKARVLYSALDDLEKVIFSAESLTPEVALPMGLSYIAQDLEYSRLKLQIAQKKGDQEDIEVYERKTTVSEDIIAKAREGQFDPAKYFFHTQGRWCLSEADYFKETEEDPTDGLDLYMEWSANGEAFLKLSDAIPVAGDPYTFDDDTSSTVLNTPTA